MNSVAIALPAVVLGIAELDDLTGRDAARAGKHGCQSACGGAKDVAPREPVKA